MHSFIHIFIHIHTYVYTYIHTYVRTYVPTYLPTYGTAQEQVNILARVGTRNKVHAHANLSHTRGASQTTHAIHEVHVSQHASQKPIPRVFKL